MEEGPEPMQLCIKSRNFTPGHFLLFSIEHPSKPQNHFGVISKSRRKRVVLPGDENSSDKVT